MIDDATSSTTPGNSPTQSCRLPLPCVPPTRLHEHRNLEMSTRGCFLSSVASDGKCPALFVGALGRTLRTCDYADFNAIQTLLGVRQTHPRDRHAAQPRQQPRPRITSPNAQVAKFSARRS
ncbi:hypothetical protein NX059_009526 [Plenodomus lindquistii]|nr:hypothetical protein NX059_009526 [Plenodomus lindquistii]